MYARALARIGIATLITVLTVASAHARRESTDWTVFRNGPTNNVTIGRNLRTEWKVVTGGGISSSPTILGDTLYIGNNHGDLDAIDVADGSVLWSHHLQNALMSQPLLYHGLVIVGMGDEQSLGSAPSTLQYVGMGPSALIALDAKTGAFRWRTAVAGSAMPTGAIVNGVLLEHNGAGWIAAIDPESGKTIYTRNLHSIASMTAVLPVAKNRVVTLGVLDNAAMQLNAADGSTVWRTRFSSTGSGHGDCPPVSDGTRIMCNYVAPGDGSSYTSVGSVAVQHAYALNVNTGAMLWDVPLQSGILPPRNEAAIPLLSNGAVYFGSAVAPYVHALDVTTGRVLWQTKVRGPVKGGMVLANGTLYFGDLKGYLWALDAKTGAVTGSKKMASGFNVGSPILVGQTLVIGSRTGSVYALPIDTIRASRDS